MALPVGRRCGRRPCCGKRQPSCGVGPIEVDPKPGALIYCDPPYRGTRPYTSMAPFDHNAFWLRVREWASDAECIVLVSEYDAPPSWAECVWQRGAKVSLNVDTNAKVATERLFVVNGAR